MRPLREPESEEVPAVYDLIHRFGEGGLLRGGRRKSIGAPLWASKTAAIGWSGVAKGRLGEIAGRFSD
jgi:hypothetical protein